MPRAPSRRAPPPRPPPCRPHPQPLHLGGDIAESGSGERGVVEVRPGRTHPTQSERHRRPIASRSARPRRRTPQVGSSPADRCRSANGRPAQHHGGSGRAARRRVPPPAKCRSIHRRSHRSTPATSGRASPGRSAGSGWEGSRASTPCPRRPAGAAHSECRCRSPVRH